MKPVDLSIVIVSFNSKDVLTPCLKSIYSSAPGGGFELIVVDNGSEDGTVEEVKRKFEEVLVIEAGYNSGYAGGNNIGFEKSRGRYVLFLNPDTVVTEMAIDQLVHCAGSSHGIGVVGPKVLNRDGSLQRSCSRSPNILDCILEALLLYRVPGYTHLFGFRGYHDDEYQYEREVDVVFGCCLLARREVLKEIEGFDEEYWMYYEDADLCERVRKKGYKVIYTPRATIVHLGEVSTWRQKPWFKIQVELSRRRFFYKYGPISSRVFLRPIFLLNTMCRLCSGILVLILTGGRSKLARSGTVNAIKVLCWQLGLQRRGSKPL